MEKQEIAVLPPNPFNPGTPVDPNDFVGRIQELESFRQKLRQTASGSLASMAVAGGYGVGKTSFLHKCKAIANEQNALTIYFSLNEVEELNRETLAKVLIQRLQEKVSEEVILKRISESILNVLKHIKLKTESGIELSFSKEEDSEFPNLHSALSAIWRVLKEHKTAIVFLIDEARMLEKNRADLILYLRAILEQLQIEHIPVMIVPAGKLTITGPSGTGFSPLVRTFPPVMLDNFSIEEAHSFINRKLKNVGLKINENTVRMVYTVTEGHPFVLTSYLNSAYSRVQAGENELAESHFKAADVEFVVRTLAPFFSRFYDQAGNMSKQILSKMAVAANCEASLSELSDSLEKKYYELSPHLAKLVQDGAIMRIERGKYKLFHHLLGKYIREKAKQSSLSFFE
ncbi:MAG: ATP-binding protein [Nanoarchaeota archaeon]